MPYFANIGKRLVKSPKIYYADPGTLSHLTGLRDPDHAAAGPMAGCLMETAVLGEIIKTLTNRGLSPLVHSGEGKLPLGFGVTAVGFSEL